MAYSSKVKLHIAVHASAGSKNLYAGFRLDNNLLKNFKKQHADNKVAPNSSLEPDLIKTLSSSWF